MEIPVEDLNEDTGMNTSLAKLHSLFLKEEENLNYDAYSSFDRITRDCGVSMADYIIYFEQCYSWMRKYKMELFDAVLAFKLLGTACLDTKDRQLNLCMPWELTFASMKSVLKRVFGGKPAALSGVGINQKMAYIMEHRWQRGKSQPQKDQQKAPVPGSQSTGQVWPQF